MSEENDLRSTAHSVCRDFLGGSWNHITEEQIGISEVTGGLSNHLYLCQLPADVEIMDNEPRVALLRIYGNSNTPDVKDVVKDSVISLLLAERKLGPQLYGVFPNGRLEEYIPSRSLTWNDLNQTDMMIAVAQTLAKMHSLRVPIKKQPTFLLEMMLSLQEAFVANISLEKLEPSKKIIAEEALKVNFKEEIEWLMCQIREQKSRVVFSHNDLVAGNILLRDKGEDNENKSSLMFIDYEYGNYNYRGYDFGFHFSEWCFSYNNEDYPHFSYDFGRFPTEEQQRGFIRAYLKQMEDLQPRATEVESEDEILKEMQIFIPLGHLVASIWSFKMALAPSITFGYWEFGKIRLDAYFSFKKKYLASRKVISNQKSLHSIQETHN